ncbi:MAG: type II toxin-antitoxin system RatA family toxin [Bradymonadaceae bacterium]
MVKFTGASIVLLTVLLLPPPLYAQDKEALDRGEISVRTVDVAGSELPKVVVQGVIDASPAKVWELVSNCDNYVRRMPRIKAARIVERKGSTVICEVTVGLPFPISDLRATTRATHVVGPPTWSRTWTLIEGDYEKNDGSWVLTPFGDDGDRTLATYSVHAIPNTSVPAWARRRAQQSSMPEIIERLRKEVKK